MPFDTNNVGPSMLRIFLDQQDYEAKKDRKKQFRTFLKKKYRKGKKECVK